MFTFRSQLPPQHSPRQILQTVSREGMLCGTSRGNNIVRAAAVVFSAAKITTCFRGTSEQSTRVWAIVCAPIAASARSGVIKSCCRRLTDEEEIGLASKEERHRPQCVVAVETARLTTGASGWRTVLAINQRHLELFVSCVQTPLV